jgi:hypothetical protein
MIKVFNFKHRDPTLMGKNFRAYRRKPIWKKLMPSSLSPFTAKSFSPATIPSAFTEKMNILFGTRTRKKLIE